MKIYIVKYYRPENRIYISIINHKTYKEALIDAKNFSKSYDDGTTFEILTFKQIEE